MTKPAKKRTKSQSLLPAVSIINQHKNYHNNPPIIEPTTFKFISNNYSVHLQCPLCKLLMIKPMRTHPCGHTFCQKCINAFVQIEVKVCPFDKCLRKFQRVQNDRTAQSLIDELKVQCTNEGCVWKGQFDKYKKTHKDSCVFRNGGLKNWLSNLTQGIVLTQINTEQKQSDRSQSFPKPLLRSQTLQPRIEESLYQDSHKQYSHYYENDHKQKEQERKQNQIVSTQDGFSIQNHSQAYTLQTKNQINSKDQSSQQQQEQPEKMQNLRNLSTVPHQSLFNQTSNQIGFSIFNMPFGPALEQQINQRPRNKQKLIKKQLKKLQS